MFKKESKLFAIFGMKCPACHEGDLFVHKGAYRMKHLALMHDRCPVCNQNYSPEPNFYYGAMYVSYAYTVALFIGVYIVFGGILEWGVWPIVGILSALLALLTPYLFRLSRSTYINVIIGYKPRSPKDS